MILAAIYFKDKDVTHLQIVDSLRPSPDHLLVNGQLVSLSHNGSWKTDNIIVEGKINEIKCGIERTIISHYMHRETGETMSVDKYTETIKSYMDENGGYKDLDNEYLCRKMQQNYVPVHRTYYEYTDCICKYEEGELTPDKYCVCNGTVKHDSNTNTNFFVYRFDKWTFCNDLVKRLMEEYGIPRVEYRTNDTPKEYYILEECRNKYSWLSFCGSEYFITQKDMFAELYNTQMFVYGTYQNCLEMENAIEARLRRAIEDHLDKMRTVSIKKSELQKLSDKIEELANSLEDKTTIKNVQIELIQCMKFIKNIGKLPQKKKC